MIAHIMLFFYLIVSSGINLHFHYCGSKLSAISFFEKLNEKDCCEKECSTRCCSDKQISFKVSDNQKQLEHSFIYKVAKQHALVNHQTFCLNGVLLSTLPYKNKICKPAPPDLVHEPLFVLHRSFLI